MGEGRCSSSDTAHGDLRLAHQHHGHAGHVHVHRGQRLGESALFELLVVDDSVLLDLSPLLGIEERIGPAFASSVLLQW